MGVKYYLITLLESIMGVKYYLITLLESIIGDIYLQILNKYSSTT